ncbi:MAG: hypothetical protein QOD81_4382 [Solirubrobacteraceae bacterium]|nr:hypothetical protein [Solirubrobacteraceae bacterium]
MRVATHNGSFHADEVFALGALSLLGEPLQIVRTRDDAVLAACDLRVDVGFRNDPATGDFDHHQRGGAGERPNGVRYASFGLVWREFGTRLAGGDPDVAARVEHALVQGVDANDTGQALSSPLVEGVRPMSVSGVIGGLNPTWEEDLTPEEEAARFDEAVAIAAGVIRREIASAGAAQRARRVVLDAIEAAADPRIVELRRNVPWKEVVVTEAPEALFVILPKRSGWGLEAVPRQLGSFENRLDLPEAWAGLDGPQLAALTGVPDAVFCHVKRFLAVARSQEGIGALAEQALAGAQLDAAA